MLIEPRVVRQISQEIAAAAEGVMDAYREGRSEDEVAITGRLVGAIEDRLNNRTIKGIRWTAHSMRTGRGVAAEEKRCGADLLGVLKIDMDSFSTAKGFLAQAKRAEPDSLFVRAEWERLQTQCEAMIKKSPDSFVFAYSAAWGVHVVPAIAVIGCKTRNLFDLYSRSIASFFETHIECFIGDPRLDSTDIPTLDALQDFPVRDTLKIVGTSGRG